MLLILQNVVPNSWTLHTERGRFWTGYSQGDQKLANTEPAPHSPTTGTHRHTHTHLYHLYYNYHLYYITIKPIKVWCHKKGTKGWHSMIQNKYFFHVKKKMLKKTRETVTSWLGLTRVVKLYRREGKRLKTRLQRKLSWHVVDKWTSDEAELAHAGEKREGWGPSVTWKAASILLSQAHKISIYHTGNRDHKDCWAKKEAHTTKSDF